MAWRLAFAGAPAFAATILARLLDSPHSVDLVYTQPPRPTGRGRKVSKSPVHLLAETAGIAVRTPPKLEGEEALLTGFDWLVVAAYGLLLPQSVLDAPRHHCLNVHASLLPRWRGAAPVERAIMAGDTETGVSIMRIEAKLDSGPVYRQRRISLGDDATGATLATDLAAHGADTLLEVLDELPDLLPQPQDDALATYARKLTSADSLIDWRKDAGPIGRQVRALSGRAAAYTTARKGIRMRLLAAQPVSRNDDSPPGTLRRIDNRWQIACGTGALAPLTVQLNRGRGTAMPMKSAANGFPKLLFDGARFGQIGDE
ncbi:MAG: methionyl-tRNA formyltransferase [Gammaproteobacteria bacterium]|nr:methionyl-tRNA formyltransferase [Gammaproteobacteria bacterium]MYK47711.1 methionyl-tRNA formyltransferase [Gammaproteobacteria bacterium]